MKEKKGEITTTMIIFIALGILVLVLVAVGFMGGFKEFTSKINILGGTDSNIGDVKISCDLACDRGDVYGFCTQNRSLNFAKDDSQKDRSDTCYGAKDIIGVECPSINCPKN